MIRRCLVVTSLMVGWLLTTANAAVADDPDLATVRAQLSADGVAFDLGANAGERAAVKDAIADSGLNLSVLVLGAEPDTQLPDLADELRGSDSGTVLVLTPDDFGASSSEYSDSDIDNAPVGDGENADAVRDFADSLTDDGGVPWVWIVVGVGVAAVALVILGRLWERRRRARADATALQAEHDRLRRDIDDLGDDIVALDPRVELIPDEATRAAYAEASAEYTAIRDRLEKPVATRAEIKAISDRIAAVKPTLTRVEQAADAAIADER